MHKRHKNGHKKPKPYTKAQLLSSLPFSADSQRQRQPIEVAPNLQWEKLKESFRINWIFHLVLLLCMYTLSRAPGNKSSTIGLTISAFVVMAYGLVVHWLSHHIEVRPWLNTYDNWFTRNKWIKQCINWGCDFIEFHSTTHHDSAINKQPTNIAYEFINNALTQGLLVIVLKYVLSLVDNKVLILWALFYASVHNINYLYVKPLTHQEHHQDALTNYGIDFMDVIFGTKYDWTHLENHNHASINLIILTGLIYAGCMWKGKSP